jgi:phenylacetate-CoA ligase
LSSTEIRNYQNRRLKDLVWYFYQNSTFFKLKMNSVNVHPYEIINLEAINKIPPLTKDEIKLNFSKNLLSSKKSSFNNLLISTSGSTGSPMSIYANSEQLKVRWANTFRAWTWTGWTPRKSQARLWHQTIGMSKSQVFREYIDNLFFKRIFIPAYKINEKSILKFINKLNRHNPFLIDGYAESFNFLVNYIKNNNIKNLNIDTIISSAQEMPESLKLYIENEIGAKVFDKYGAREFSGIAYESKNHSGHLISDDSYIVELLKNLIPVEEGETGEVFITDLNNYVTPMIRYQIGDLAIRPSNESFKNNKIQFRTLGEIQGRTKAIIICENNTWVPGTFFAHFFKEYSELIKSYQVIQNVLEEIELKLVKNINASNASIDKMINELRKTVGNIRINISYHEKIEMIKTGKIMGAISNLDTSKIMNNNFEKKL